MEKNKTAKIIMAAAGLIMGAAVSFFLVNYLMGNWQGDKNIEKMVEEIDASCPQQVDEMTILEHFVLSDDFATYQYTIKGASVDDLDLASLKSNIEAGALFKNADAKLFVNLISDSGRGICYEYEDVSGKVVRIKFTPDELKKLIDTEK